MIDKDGAVRYRVLGMDSAHDAAEIEQATRGVHGVEALLSVATAQLAGRVGIERRYVRQQFLEGREPAPEGTRLRQAQRVQVTGQLFYDDAHVGEAPRGRVGELAGTLWEIHPVTRIARLC